MYEIKTSGKPLGEATKVAVLIHGRGASAASILGLKDDLRLNDFALMAPQAFNNTWYPYSFMAPDQSNEPAFSQAIATINGVVSEIIAAGYLYEQIYFIGFSQGACLTLEYTAQNPRKYGGVIAFTGGLIGEKINKKKYKGDFQGTSIFIGAGNQDMHVPLSRIEASEEILRNMGAKVKTLLFKDTQHTIRPEELTWVNQNILNE
jgi:phospholipase/carboxylesterase